MRPGPSSPLGRCPALLLLLTLVPLHACADPHEPSAKTFARVLQSQLPGRPPCLRTGPYPTVERITTAPYRKPERVRGAERHDALIAAGLVRIARESTTEIVGIRSTDRMLELTDAGRTAYREDLPGAGGPHRGFCYGQPELVQVVRFTEPAEMLGHRISQVTYTFRLRDVPDWARNREIGKVFGGEVSALQAESSPIEATMPMVLTSDGWIPEDQVPTL